MVGIRASLASGQDPRGRELGRAVVDGLGRGMKRMVGMETRSSENILEVMAGIHGNTYRMGQEKSENQ